MKKIHVALGAHAYDIEIAAGLPHIPLDLHI